MYPKIYDVVEILLNNILDLNTNYPKSYDVVAILLDKNVIYPKMLDIGKIFFHENRSNWKNIKD